MQPTTPQKPKEQESLFWRVLPTRVVMQFFRNIDKQESPTLTHTVGHVVGSFFLVGVPAAVLIFWKHIPAVISFLFGRESLLRQPIELEIWLLLLCIAVSLLGVGCFVWILLRRPVIHSAEYGANARPDGVQCKPDDVRWKVEKEVRHGGRRIPAENLFFGEGDPEYDPCRDVFKSLTIDYCVHGDRKVKTVAEHQHIDLD